MSSPLCTCHTDPFAPSGSAMKITQASKSCRPWLHPSCPLGLGCKQLHACTTLLHCCTGSPRWGHAMLTAACSLRYNTPYAKRIYECVSACAFCLKRTLSSTAATCSGQRHCCKDLTVWQVTPRPRQCKDTLIVGTLQPQDTALPCCSRRPALHQPYNRASLGMA